MLLIFLLLVKCSCQEEDIRNFYQEEIDKNLRNQMESGECTIPVEFEPITQDEFMKKYAYKSPVVFKRNEFQEKRNKIFKIKSQIDNLLTEYADKHVTLSTANTYSYKKYTMRLADYIREQVLGKSISSFLRNSGNETLYFFGNNNYTEWNSLFELYEKPIYNLPNHLPIYSFGVAAAGTGVPFHFHGPGFAETMHGRKRWFLYAPQYKPNFDPDESTLKWLVEDYPKMKNDGLMLECILEPFDIIYFPDRWWHATLNLDIAVFISTFISAEFY